MLSLRCRVLVVASVLAFCVAGTTNQLYAQRITGAIEGTVEDQTGGRLPGVTVSISSPGLIGGAQIQVTGPDGSFRFPVLATGNYTVTFELAVFQTVERNVVVELERTVTLDQVLAPAGVAEEVTVTAASPMVDVRSTQVATTVDDTIVQEVPVPRRFTDLLNVMPGVQDGLYTFSPVNTVYGSRVTNNVYQVDGASFVDPQVQSASTDIAYDDIQEVQMSTSGQSAEFGSASGGVFNFITKSGGNAFKGLLSGYFQTKGLTGDNITDELAADGIRPSLKDHVYDMGGNLGGPIVRDRLWFFGSYYNYSDAQSYSDFPVPTEIDQWQVNAKLNAQVTDKNRVSLYTNYRDRLWKPWNFGYTTAGDSRTWLGIGWHNWLTTGNWTMFPDENTIVEMRGGITLYDLINQEPFTDYGTPVYREQTTGVYSGGPWQSAGLAQRDRYELKGDVTRFVADFLGGQHDLKTGVQYEALRMDTERRDQAQADYLRHYLLNDEPYRVQLMAGPGNTQYKIDHLAAYLQDQWSLGERLTLNLGVRYDHWNGGISGQYGGGPWFPPENPPDQDGIIPLSMVAPRLGMAWDITGTRKWAFKASYGRFYQRIGGTDISGLAVNNQGSLTYDWVDLNGDMVYQPGEEGSLRSDGRPTGTAEIDPNLKMPYSDSFNVGIEVELPNAFGLAVNGIIKREKDHRSYINLNKPFDTAYDLVSVNNPLSGESMQIYSIKPEFQALPPNNYLTNPDDPVPLWSSYDGIEFVLRRRLQDNWMMQASYNLGRVYGTIGSMFWDAQSDPYSDPNNLIFVEGDQSFDRRHMLKAMGLYLFPYGIQLSGDFKFMSGMPLFTSGSGGRGVTGAYYARYTQAEYPGIQTSAFIDLPGEPQGTRKLTNQTLISFRLQKRVDLGRTFALDVMLDVFNLLNASTVTRVESLQTVQSNFLRPAQILEPRAARVGFRLSF